MVSRAQIQAIADQIAAKFPAVERIILFGSYAYGTPTPDSDIDLLVLKTLEHREHEDAVRIRTSVALPTHSACDIIVRDPVHAMRRYQWFDPLIREAFDKGEVLYERSRAGMA